MGNIALKVDISRLQHKIKSKSGASITYALLLFLVCATVSSVILAAGTAASGRISQSADSDQRYYAVTSAARLMKELVEMYEVEIVKTIDPSNTSDVSFHPYYRIKGNSGWRSYIKDPPDTDTGEAPVITMAAAKYYTKVETFSGIPPSYSINVSEEPTLDVNIVENIDDESGQIVIEINSTQGLSNNSTGENGDDPAFTMMLRFAPKIKESTRKTEQESDGKTTITSMSWSLMSNGVKRYETS